METKKEKLTQEEMDRICDRIWENNKDKAVKAHEGTYIDLDTMTIKNEGLSQGDMMSPGNLTTWKNQQRGSRYFLEGFGRGMTRMFRR